MKKILFLIHDLGPGGAEKVLVNLVNNMERTKFDITVMTLFDIGVNRQFLNNDITYKTVFPKSFPGNSHVMKLLSPQMLHKLFIKEHYDMEVSYLEGPCARIISGCPHQDTKLVCWIHSTMHSKQDITNSFRSYDEAVRSYNRMDAMVYVAGTVRDAFQKYCQTTKVNAVLYNTNESDKIIEMSKELIEEPAFVNSEFRMIGVGKITQNKGFDRLIRITKRLRTDGLQVHTYILGEGEQAAEITKLIDEYGLEENITLLGYQKNPYKYVSKCDLFVCSSHSEGFSTAATEALIVGTPVCTVEVSGMKEMLGENNEYGIVTENDEEALYQGIKQLLDDPKLLEHYRQKAVERGKTFSTENTVKAVEKMLLNL